MLEETMLKKLLTTATLVLAAVLSSPASAQEEGTTFKGESEASSVFVSGNLNSSLIGAKTKNTWNLTDMDAAIVFGSYIDGKAEALDSTGQIIDALTKYWNAGLRYERVITKDQFTVFVQHMAEHDPYNGVYVQKNSTDLGVKYTILKDDQLNWFVELGYRYTGFYQGQHTVDNVVKVEDYNTNYIRGYTEVSNKFNESVSGKLWFEYLQDTKESDQSLWNAEASLSVALNKTFSLKSAYLNRHNEGIPAPDKKDTGTWTTALVASY